MFGRRTNSDQTREDNWKEMGVGVRIPNANFSNRD
jgi:hypothetical protein